MKGNSKTAVLTAGGKAYTAADLAAACEASIEASLAALPDIFPEPEVSERFAKSVERLDRRYVRGVALRRAGRAAAAVFLALILCFSAFLTVDAQARGALMNWWKELTSESAVYWFEGSGQEQGAAAGSYAPSWVPEGLKLVREAQRGSFASLFYEGDAGMLAFEYSMGDVKGAYEIVGEDEGRSVSINGLEGWLHEDDGRVNLIWTDEEKGVVFTIGSDLPAEDVLRAAESVTETPSDER